MLLTEPVQSYFRETDLPSLLCTLLFFSPSVQPGESLPQEFALQFWNDDKATNAGLILEAIGLLLGSKGAGVGNNYIFLWRRIIDVCILYAAPRGLRFHKIAHRNGTCVERANQAQSQGRTMDTLYGFYFHSYHLHFPSVSAFSLPLLRPSYRTSS